MNFVKNPNMGKTKTIKQTNLLRSDLNVPEYFGLDPIRSIISGIQEANTAKPTSINKTINVRPKVVLQCISP